MSVQGTECFWIFFCVSLPKAGEFAFSQQAEGGSSQVGRFRPSHWSAGRPASMVWLVYFILFYFIWYVSLLEQMNQLNVDLPAKISLIFHLPFLISHIWITHIAPAKNSHVLICLKGHLQSHWIFLHVHGVKFSLIWQYSIFALLRKWFFFHLIT